MVTNTPGFPAGVEVAIDAGGRGHYGDWGVGVVIDVVLAAWLSMMTAAGAVDLNDHRPPISVQ